MEKDVRIEKTKKRICKLFNLAVMSIINNFEFYLKKQESDDEEYDAAEYPQRVGRQKHVLDIDIQFNDNRRAAGGGRGGRGQRPGGNRGGDSGGRGGDGIGSRGSSARGRGGDSGGGGAVGNNGVNVPAVDRPERRYREEAVSIYMSDPN